jgi:ribosome biogenesis GTPase A
MKQKKKAPIPKIYQDIKDCNLVLELRDIRIPHSSRVKFLHSKFDSKKSVVLLSKSDLATPEYRQSVLNWFKKQNIDAYCISTTETPKKVLKLFQTLSARYTPKSSLLGVLRVLMIGLPNVGKSSFINVIRGKTVARVANAPGVTKGRQWIKIDQRCYLLDSPGVATLTNTGDDELRLKFATCRMISEKEYDYHELMSFLYSYICKNKEALSRLEKEGFHGEDFDSALTEFGRSLHLKNRGDNVDMERAAQRLYSIFEKDILPSVDLDGILG